MAFVQKVPKIHRNLTCVCVVCVCVCVVCVCVCVCMCVCLASIKVSFRQYNVIEVCGKSPQFTET